MFHISYQALYLFCIIPYLCAKALIVSFLIPVNIFVIIALCCLSFYSYLFHLDLWL